MHINKTQEIAVKQGQVSSKNESLFQFRMFNEANKRHKTRDLYSQRKVV